MNKKLVILLVAVLLVAVAAVALFVFVLGGEKEVPFVRTEHTPGDYFVTNVKDSYNLLKVTVVLVLDTDTITKMLTENEATIRDTILTVLRLQDAEALKAADLTPVKQAIRDALNEKLEIENIIDILFYDYALQ